MELSKDRILTTHVGSLPRPDDLAALLLAKEHEDSFQEDASFAAVIERAVDDIVRRQVEVGVAVPSDGEMSKIGYATYIKDRLSGFEGDSERKVSLDLLPYPEFRTKVSRMTGTQPFKRPRCTGPISIKDSLPLQMDIERFKSALKKAGLRSGFMNAASPGVISAFQPNEYYRNHQSYIDALASVMKSEYESIVRAGLTLQIDCPDLAMARHTAFQDLDEAEFLHRVDMHVDALNGALESIPATAVRMHVCWGNYEGPHDYDIDLEKIMPAILRAKPAAISFEASNPRHAHEWKIWASAKMPDDKILLPGVIDSTTNFVEHPELVAQRIEIFAGIVGKERVIASSDCGFGTFAGYGKMDPEIVFRKVEAQTQGASIASSRLWAG